MANMFGLGCKSKKVVNQVVKPTEIPKPKKPITTLPKASVLQPALKYNAKMILPAIAEEENNQNQGCVCF
jgi:hypothetical protein